MTFGLLGSPISMIMSLLMMQGLSLTMFRTFLNQAIPRLDPMRFNLNLGNSQSTSSTTPAPVSGFNNNNNLDINSLLPLLNLLAPALMQQNQMVQSRQSSQMPLQTPVPQMGIMAPVGQQIPQVIIVPQMMHPSQFSPSSIKTTTSASTLHPLQIDPPPDGDQRTTRVTKRMLERPPHTTTRKPSSGSNSSKVLKRAHAGAMHIGFATPKAPGGFRRYVVPAVTVSNPFEPDFSAITETSQTDTQLSDSQSPSGGDPTTTTSSPVNSDNNRRIIFNSIQSYTSSSTTTMPSTSTTLADNLVANISTVTLDPVSDTLTTTDRPVAEVLSTSTTTTTTTSSTEVNDENNLQNHNMNPKTVLNETLSSMTDSGLVHQDFRDHVMNMSDSNQIDSHQYDHESSIYFDNSKESVQFKRVCFYLLRAKDGELKISDIDPFICTHLIVGFASVDNNKDLLVPKDETDDPDKYRELTNLKSVNRNLKVMLSVGDGKESKMLSKIVSDEISRDNFVASVLDMCDMFAFDGIDIDWEFPVFKTGTREDKQNFIYLLKELKEEANRRFRDDFIISATVATPLVIAMAAYDIPLMAEAVDFVNLMSYDFNTYRADRPYTGHHSPLYPRPTEKGYYLTLNAAWAATYWANKGMPLRKIILGIPTYARTYNLVVPVSQGLDVPVTGPGIGDGKLNYTMVCHFLASGATKEFDVYSQVPFAYKNFDWIAYESDVSAALKAQWVVKAGMGGVMTYALNYDDSKGVCRRDGKKFPIQKAISNLLELSSIRSYQRTGRSPTISRYITKQ